MAAAVRSEVEWDMATNKERMEKAGMQNKQQ